MQASNKTAAAAGDTTDHARQRALATEARMSDDERFAMIVSVLGPNLLLKERDPRMPDDAPSGTGYMPGVPRLGVPALTMTDASLGVANAAFQPGSTATALPASLALGASFNPQLATEAGAMVGREARERGYNVLLGGGINLARDPRNGRNFEYISEDPLLTATIGAAAVRGTQSEGVISTLKHFSLNANETSRHWLDAVIDPAAHRESDLLAFELAIEWSRPGAVMAAYNKVNGVYAADSDELLNRVLKQRWGFDGWVMSDWGGTPSSSCAMNGLDQESGAQVDRYMWGKEPFGEPLRRELAEGRFAKARLSDMVRRILTSMYRIGVDRWEPVAKVDMARHREIALAVARQGMVLLKNDAILPLDGERPLRIAVIGGFALTGVPAGAGSSAVTPPGGYADSILIGGPGFMGAVRKLFLLPSSPLEALREQLPQAQITFDPGMSPASAAAVAARADVAIAFGIRVESEAFDSSDLDLPWGQDATITAVAAANPNTVVVLETGNPTSMPWRDAVKGIVQAWYPGQAGGQAIAEILTGRVNPSGRLPMTFPLGLSQTPRPELPYVAWGAASSIHYHEGAEVGYRWCAHAGQAAMFPFGHGLSYTRFRYSDFELRGGETVHASVTVTNEGDREGADVPQVYLLEAPDGARMRLLGFERVALKAGESRRVTMSADARLLARFDAAKGQWAMQGGEHLIALGHSAGELVCRQRVSLQGRLFGR